LSFSGKKLLSLWGMPGSGKTTVGRILSELFQIPFYDLDDIICRDTGRSSAEWIKQKGEAIFRKTEHDALKKFLSENLTPSVLSLGGGTPAFCNNVELLKKHTCSVYIYCSPEVLIQRIASDKQERPLLYVEHEVALNEKIKKLLEHREYYYRMADYCWDNSRTMNENVKKELKEFFGKIMDNFSESISGE